MPLNYTKLMQTKFEPITAQYFKRDTMLYALGLGIGGSNPIDAGELKYVYERDLVALPTFAVTLAADPMLFSDPDFGINYTMLLHGEQSLQLHKPLPVEGTVISQTQIDEIYDKGAAKGAVMYVTRRIFDQNCGDLLVTLGSVAFLRADGGFGGKSDGAPKLRAVPERPADVSVPIYSALNQALIYRLAGDYNPLHVDPEVARRAGFDRPILHGLCAYGMVGRTLIKLLCGDDPSRTRRLNVRFSSPVYPGESLHIAIWKVAAGEAAFRLIATERNVVVQDFGLFEYQD